MEVLFGWICAPPTKKISSHGWMISPSPDHLFASWVISHWYPQVLVISTSSSNFYIPLLDIPPVLLLFSFGWVQQKQTLHEPYDTQTISSKKCKQKPYCSLGQQSWLYQQKPAGFGAWTLDVLDLSCLKKSWHKHTLRRCPRCKWWSRSRFCCWSTSLVPRDFSSTVWGSCSRLNDLATNTSVFHWEIMCRFTKHW